MKTHTRTHRLAALLLLLPLLLSCTAFPDLGLGDLDPNVSKEFPNGEAYLLSYTSNGDGTCYVSSIRINPATTDPIAVNVPATSPDGDRVVEIRTPLSTNLPTLLQKAAYQNLFAKLQTAVDNGTLDSFTYNRLASYFSFKGIGDFMSLDALQELRQEYPLGEFTNLYVLAKDLSLEEAQWIGAMLYLHAGYTSTDWYNDCRALLEFAKSIGKDSKIILDTLPSVAYEATGGEKITALSLPAGVTTLNPAALAPFVALEQVSLPGTLKELPAQAFAGMPKLTSIHFDGTQEQWTALPKGSNWSPSGSLTVQCTNGSVEEP